VIGDKERLKLVKPTREAAPVNAFLAVLNEVIRDDQLYQC
jgi:hypothetical protein